MLRTIYQFVWHFIIYSLLLLGSWQVAQAQANMQVRVLSIEAVNTEDCDGFPFGNSDFMWEYKVTDNTLGRTNNNANFITGGLISSGISAQANYALVAGNNGPYVETTPNNSIFSPANGTFFNWDYVCAADVPTALNFEWGAYEADEPIFGSGITVFSRDGNTGVQPSTGLTIPASGSSGPQTFSASGTNGGCNQTYRITVEVIVTPLTITPVASDICSALPLTIGTGVAQFSWCGNQLPLQPGEPELGEINNHGSAWFYFVAPPSGQVRIQTDLNETDFGTELVLYHAADGIGCIHGNNNWSGFPIANNPIKQKFDYLSYQGNADDDIILTAGKATAYFSDVVNAAPAIRDGHALLAGEVYYIQVTTDAPNQRGYLSLRLDDRGGSPFVAHDIPCTGVDVSTDAQSTVVRTELNGLPFSAQLSRGRTSDEEVGPPYVGTDAREFRAYDYVPTTSNNLNGSMWVQFTAPESGRIYFESDLDNALFNENENAALYAPDPRFGPGQPTDLFCSNIVQIAEVEGGLGGVAGGTKTAIITEQCLEPGYTYYGMVDPTATATASEAEVWVYDPSAADPVNNPPKNDILCLALRDTVFRVPVKPANQTIPFSAVAGRNTNACIEALAGEPFSNPSNSANQTVWHYFVVPPSGVVEMKLRAYIGMNRLNYAVYPLLNDSLCYGGLQPATYTVDGTQSTAQIRPIASGTTDFNGDVVGLCCLEPGTVYAIQLDGGSSGDQGQYIIEYINEIEVYAGDAQYSVAGDTFDYRAVDTGFVCFSDTLFPSVVFDALGNSTTNIANCMDIGFVVQDSVNIPDSIINGNFIFIDSVYGRPRYWVNDGNNPISTNAVHYVSPMADKQTTWGQLTCPSASAENGAPFVFLTEIILNTSYNSNNCIITFNTTGGLPDYNGSLYDYVITDAANDTVAMGQIAHGVSVNFGINVAGLYTIMVTDNVGCGQMAMVNATPCLDPCINNPVFITPDPADSTVYTCYPGGDSARVTLQLNGGEPSQTAGDLYTVIVSGSTTPGGNGTSTTAGNGTPTPVSFSFSVNDGDTWVVVVSDANGCLDTLSGTFTYDLTNCPDYCALNPITTGLDYLCNTDGSALVQVTLGGGQAAIDGSNYTVQATGSTITGQSPINAQVAGTIGGTSDFSFLVDDGDTWMVQVVDLNGCTDTLTATYTFDTANCPICLMMPVQLFPDPVDSSVYACNGDGTAQVDLFATGGAPSSNGSLYNIAIAGSSLIGQNGTRSQGVGSFNFQVDNGDAWSVIAVDQNGCADTASGRYLDNPYNLAINSNGYTCRPNQTAVVQLLLSGGHPSLDGSNYLVTIVGTAGGGATGFQVPVPGTIGDSSRYNFVVQNGDNWLAVVTDNNGCITDSLRGTFNWNPNNCGNLCDDPSYQAIITEGLGGTINYQCDGMGNALLQLSVAGGLPTLTAGGADYTAAITINNTTTLQTIAGLPTGGLYELNLQNGDVWSVLLYDDLGCDSASLNGVFTSVEAIATATTPPNMLVGQQATLDGSASTGNIDQYRWTPSNTVSDATAMITQTMPLSTTHYLLTVSDTAGCIDTASVLVEVGSCIPRHSGFTPNGDGVNDLWEIPCLNLYDNRVQVYNRWGQLIFEAQNYDSTWDGTSLGQALPDATYYYVIAVDDPLYAEPVIYKGTVSIIR